MLTLYIFCCVGYPRRSNQWEMGVSEALYPARGTSPERLHNGTLTNYAPQQLHAGFTLYVIALQITTEKMTWPAQEGLAALFYLVHASCIRRHQKIEKGKWRRTFPACVTTTVQAVSLSLHCYCGTVYRWPRRTSVLSSTTVNQSHDAEECTTFARHSGTFTFSLLPGMHPCNTS